jgi:hypothetical protein
MRRSFLKILGFVAILIASVSAQITTPGGVSNLRSGATFPNAGGPGAVFILTDSSVHPAGFYSCNRATGCLVFSDWTQGGGGSGGGIPWPTAAGIPVYASNAWVASLTVPTGNLVGTGQSNAFTTGVQDFSAATQVRLRVGAGLTASSSGDIGQDTSTGYWHAYKSGDKLLVTSTNVGAVGQAFLSGGDGTGTFADPVVSGPDAPGTGSTRPPVQIGGYDGANVQRVLVSPQGRLSVDVNTSPNTTVSGTVVATQSLGNNLHVVVDAAPSTAVTGTVTANAGTGTFAVSDANFVAQNSASAGVKGSLQLGAVTTGAPAYTTSQVSPLSLDIAGNLRVIAAANAAINQAQLSGVALGAPSLYGTSPGSVMVPGVNAFVTNGALTTIQGAAGSNIQSWWTQLGDGTNGPVAVRPASTAAVAANPSLVVQLSPNQPNLSSALNVNCTSGCSGSPGFTDNTAFTSGSSIATNIGGVYNDGVAALTSGNAGVLRLTSDRMLFANIGKVNGVALGSPSLYGTSPGSVNVQGVNAFVTNVPAVSQSGTWSVRNVGNAGAIFDASAGAVAAANSILIGGVYNSSAPTPSTGQQEPFQLDASGSLKVNVVSGSTGNAAAGNTGAVVPTQADYLGANVGGTMRGLTAVNPTGSVYALQTDHTSVNGVALGSPSLYGTSPGAVNVQGVNAFVTNVPAVSQSGTWTVTGAGGTFPATQSGNWSVRVLGNGGAAVDGTVAAAGAPTNQIVTGGVYNSTLPTLTTGQAVAVQLDAKGQHLEDLNYVAGTALGTPTTYGVAPSGNVIGVNAFVTNVNANGQSTAANSAPVVIASDQSAVKISGSTGVVDASTAQNVAMPASGFAILGEYNTTPTTISSGNASPFQLDSAGNLLVNIKAGSSGNGAASSTGSAVPAQADYNGVNVAGTLRGRTGVNPTGSVYAAQTDLTSANGVVLGSPSNYGTAPGAVAVLGVNAFVTNSPSVVQSGTWTVQPGNTANTTAWLVTGTGGTFPVTQSTAANLNATVVGTGTFAVQAAQSGNWTTRLVGNSGAVMDAAGQNAASPANELLIAGQFNTTPTTITSGNISPFQLDSAGNLLVNVKAGSSGNAAASATAAAVPASADYSGINVSGTLRGQTGVNPTGSVYASQIDLASSNAVALGTPNTFGTTAPTGNALGVNSSLFLGTTLATAATFGTTAAGTGVLTNSSLFCGTTVCGTAASGVLKVGVVGGAAGATVDAVIGAATAPTNQIVTGGVYNSTLPTLTTGQSAARQLDAKGQQLVDLNYVAGTALGVPTNFGTTPGAVVAASVNASLFSGTTALGTPNTFGTTAPTGNALGVNSSLFLGTTLATAATFGTTASGTGLLVNASLFCGTTVCGTAASGVQKVGIVGNAGAAVDAATGAAPPANAVYVAGRASGATGGFLSGITVCDSGFVVNISTATTTLAVTGVSGRQVRICAINLVAAAADNVALIEGTGATCGTGTAGMAGGTTAATGWNFAANGGLTMGSGLGEVMTTATAGDSVCLATSAATQLSGYIKYAIL